MYRILVASPKGPYGDAVIDPSADTSDYFTSEHASCFISLDPSDAVSYTHLDVYKRQYLHQSGCPGTGNRNENRSSSA